MFTNSASVLAGLLKFEAFVIEAFPFLLHLTAFGANIYLVNPLGGVVGAWAPFTV